MDLATLFGSFLKPLIDQLFDNIEHNIIEKFKLEEYTDLIYSSEPVNNPEKQINVEGYHLIGLCLIEIWFNVKNNFDNFTHINAEQFSSLVAHVISEGLKTALAKYYPALLLFTQGKINEIFASSQLNDLISKFNSIICNANTPETLAFRASFSAALRVIFDKNMALRERCRCALSILFSGYLKMIGIDNISVNNLNDLLTILNQILSNSFALIERIVNSIADPYIESLRRNVQLLEAYNARLANLDIERFRQETETYRDISLLISSAQSTTELLTVLRRTLQRLNIHTSWENHRSFDDFMSDKSRRMEFR